MIARVRDLWLQFVGFVLALKDAWDEPEACPRCGGTGIVDHSLGGRGPGAFVKHPCPDCDGAGYS